MTEQKRLYRSCKNRMLGGVCGGLGEYFNIDPVFIRIGLVLFALAYGIGVLFYLIAWAIIPEDPACQNPKCCPPQDTEETEKAVPHNKTERIEKDRSRIIVGSILLVAGIIFLLQNILKTELWHNFWPVIIIAIGLGIILKSINRGEK